MAGVARRLQRRPPPSGGLRLVGHAVGDEEDALAHQLPPSTIIGESSSASYFGRYRSVS